MNAAFLLDVDTSLPQLRRSTGVSSGGVSKAASATTSTLGALAAVGSMLSRAVQRLPIVGPLVQHTLAPELLVTTSTSTAKRQQGHRHPETAAVAHAQQVVTTTSLHRHLRAKLLRRCVRMCLHVGVPVLTSSSQEVCELCSHFRVVILPLLRELLVD